MTGEILSTNQTAMILVYFNNTKLGKRWIKKVYHHWELIATFPSDSLEWILKQFRTHEINSKRGAVNQCRVNDTKVWITTEDYTQRESNRAESIKSTAEKIFRFIKRK